MTKNFKLACLGKMKKLLFTLAAVVTLFSAGSACGQTRSFRANVPFAFTIGGQTFPAGTYQFQSLLGKPGSNREHGMLAIRNLDGHHMHKVVFTDLVQPFADARPASKVVFSMADGRRQLSLIWVASDSIGLQLPETENRRLVAEADNEEVLLAELR